ncbi:hypothetical protein [Rhodoferax sp. GW822-FHT02A01]|uniref:hypothetical protein n=1 Tax=Rhodoferax sp. GW822-FHT02A01 TaxID=3141537 RepID=UPI00315CCE8B
MPQDTFRASVQYGDFKGSSAADRADKADADDWLTSKGLKTDDEFLLGIKLFSGESHGVHKDPVNVQFLLVKPRAHDSVKSMLDTTPGPIPVRRVDVQMPLVEFFGLFKRLSITLSPHGMIEGRDYIWP